MKILLLVFGLLLCLWVSIFKPSSQDYHHPQIELPINAPSLQKRSNSVPIEPGVAHYVTAGFPEAALPILDSFKRIEREFYSKKVLIRASAEVGRSFFESPYVYYDISKPLPSVDNSIRHEPSNRIDAAGVASTDLKIIWKIVGEEVTDFDRRMAFVSYGNFLSLFFSFRLKKAPLSYEKFLTTVFLSLSEIKIGVPDSVYLPFLEEVLLPLSHDLARKGQARPPIVVDDAFIERMSRYVYQDRSELPKWLVPTKYLIRSFTFPEPIPPEILWSGIYKKIDHLIGAKYYKDPYYLLKYYRALTAEGDDAITWGEALDVDVWCNYYINSLIENQFEEKIDEIKDLMLNLLMEAVTG